MIVLSVVRTATATDVVTDELISIVDRWGNSRKTIAYANVQVTTHHEDSQTTTVTNAIVSPGCIREVTATKGPRVQVLDKKLFSTELGYIHQRRDGMTELAVNWHKEKNDLVDSFDPRLIGIIPVPCSAINQFRLDAIPSMKIAQVSSTRDGDLCTYAWNADNVNFRLTVDTAHDYSLVRCVGQHADGYEEIDFVWGKPAGESDLSWFPTQVSRRRLDSNQKVVASEVSTILVNYLTSTESSGYNTCGIGSLDLPAGIRIIEHPAHEKGSRIWNGSDVAVSGASEGDDLTSSSVPWRRYIFAGNALIVAVVMAICLYKHLRQRNHLR